MSEFQASNFKKENGGTPDLLGKTELTSPYFFVPPSGTTEERPESCAAVHLGLILILELLKFLERYNWLGANTKKRKSIFRWRDWF